MDRNTRKLLIVSVLYLINAGLGTALALRDDIPAEFAGIRTGKPVWRDFVTLWGTGLSAPLFMLVAHALFIILAGRGVRAGEVGLRVNAAVFIIGMLGEPVAYRALNPRTFDAPKALVVAGNLILPALTIRFGRMRR